MRGTAFQRRAVLTFEVENPQKHSTLRIAPLLFRKSSCQRLLFLHRPALASGVPSAAQPHPSRTSGSRFEAPPRSRDGRNPSLSEADVSRAGCGEAGRRNILVETSHWPWGSPARWGIPWDLRSSEEGSSPAPATIPTLGPCQLFATGQPNALPRHLPGK